MSTKTCNTLPVRGMLSECGQQNVGETERWMSLIGGSILAAHGLTRGSVMGLAVAAMGAGLLYRGATGHCAMYESLEMNTAQRS